MTDSEYQYKKGMLDATDALIVDMCSLYREVFGNPWNKAMDASLEYRNQMAVEIMESPRGPEYFTGLLAAQAISQVHA